MGANDQRTSEAGGSDENLKELLHLAQKRFSNLIRSLPVSIAIANSHGQIEASSPQLRVFLAYEEGELEGKRVDELLPNVPWKNSTFEQWHQENQDKTTELEVCAKDGERIIVDFSVKQLEQDKCGRQVVIIQDATERFLANKLKEEFFQMINHDIRAPLSGVATFLDSLQESNKYGALTDLGAERLSLAMLNIERIKSLASGFLELSGLESGQVLKVQEISTKNLVITAQASVRELADAKQIAIKSTVEALTLTADGERLTQVLVNLLANAIEHSPSGAQIELSARQQNSSYSISIRDYGQGIPESDKLLIFERFRRASGNKSAGFGLGLSIANQIIKQHGGTISCTNPEEGEGSVFSFSIPLRAFNVS